MVIPVRIPCAHLIYFCGTDTGNSDCQGLNCYSIWHAEHLLAAQIIQSLITDYDAPKSPEAARNAEVSEKQRTVGYSRSDLLPRAQIIQGVGSDYCRHSVVAQGPSAQVANLTKELKLSA